MKIRLIALFASVLLLVGATACAPNPADDVPAADVNTGEESTTTQEQGEETEDEMDEDEMDEDEDDAEGHDDDMDQEGDDEDADEDSAAGDDDMALADGAIALNEGTVSFVGSKVTRSHECFFDAYEATLDPGDGTADTAQLIVVLDTTTIYCDPEESGQFHDKFNNHIRSDDFLYVDQFPTATFVSTSIVEGGEGGTHTITGDLTLKDVTQEITFPATIEVGEDAVSGNAEFSVNRQDWGLAYPGSPDDLIRDEVVLMIALSGAR